MHYLLPPDYLRPDCLAQDMEARRDALASEDQRDDARRIMPAFRYARVLFSSVQMRADAFLRQN